MSPLECGVCHAPVTADGGYCACPGNRDADPPAPAAAPPPAKQPHGFARLSRAERLEISYRGGKAAHAAGTAHRFTAAEARAAGRKGGIAAHRKGAAHCFTTDEARAAGKKGGRASLPPPPVFENNDSGFVHGWAYQHITDGHRVVGYPTRAAAARAYRRHVKKLLGACRVVSDTTYGGRWNVTTPDGRLLVVGDYLDAVRAAVRYNAEVKEGKNGHGGHGGAGGAGAGTNPRTPEVAGEGRTRDGS